MIKWDKIPRSYYPVFESCDYRMTCEEFSRDRAFASGSGSGFTPDQGFESRNAHKPELSAGGVVTSFDLTCYVPPKHVLTIPPKGVFFFGYSPTSTEQQAYLSYFDTITALEYQALFPEGQKTSEPLNRRSV